MTEQPAVSTDEAMAFAGCALGAAGHQITDPYIRELLRRVHEGAITGAEFERLVDAHIDAK